MSERTSTPVTFARIPPRRSTSRAATWWGRAWVRAVEEASYSDHDLHAARVLSRSGAIGGITVDAGTVVAACYDRADVWSVTATVPPLDPISRRAMVEVVAGEAGHLAAILAGELPHRLVEHAEEAGVELLPYGGELGSSCACGSWVDPCVHALAVMLQVAWLVDGDPGVLLRLRGLPADELQAAVAAESAPQPVSEVIEGDLAAAVDAAARAARVLALADEPSADLGHLF
ncbi:MAG: SWIM zinc finger family protein [Nocardioides sp.]